MQESTMSTDESVAAAVNELLDFLRRARTSQVPHPRHRCYAAVAACAKFISQVGPLGNNLHEPLLTLASALEALDEGRVTPILEPTDFGNRPPDATEVHALRANLAAVFDVLRRPQFSVRPSVASSDIADVAAKAGLRIASEISDTGGRGRLVASKDIERWRRVYSKLGERHRLFTDSLSVLERAVQRNPDCPLLLRQKLIERIRELVASFVEFNPPLVK